MQWYYSKNTTQLGPVTDAEIRAKLASGEIAKTDLVWKDGMRDWQPAGGVAELAAISLTPPAGPPSATSPYLPPSAQPAPSISGKRIPNYLWQSIVVAVFCCPPFGIPAIVYAAQVDGLVARGDIPGAMAASAKAKLWCNIAAGSIIVLVLLGMLGTVLENAGSR